MTAFDALFVPQAIRESVSGDAWLRSFLRFESALARAGAEVGLVPQRSSDTIVELCAATELDWDELLERGRSVANPVEPLVRSLRAAAGSEHERYVHLGATSQDVLDTASMLVARDAIALVCDELERAGTACAALARTHRATPVAARTLLQQAVPTTFGLVAAGWLVALLDAKDELARARAGVRMQLGGAAGTLAAFGDRGLRVVELVATDLELAVPVLPWHTNRVRIATLGAALATAAGVCGKVAQDVVLLAQTEVGEVREAAGGGSSAMPQKRNPARAVLARAAARGAAGHASVLQASLEQELGRAAGAWQSEWGALSGALALTGGAAAALADSLWGLEVDVERMRSNLGLTGGLVTAERVAATLAERLGGADARDVVAEAAASGSFREALLADSRVGLAPDDLDALLDPAGYVGSAPVLVDRALAWCDERNNEEG